jgi:hypothetical protein
MVGVYYDAILSIIIDAQRRAKPLRRAAGAGPERVQCGGGGVPRRDGFVSYCRVLILEQVCYNVEARVGATAAGSLGSSKGDAE